MMEVKSILLGIRNFFTIKRVIVYSLLIVVSGLMIYSADRIIRAQSNLESVYDTNTQKTQEILESIYQYREMLVLFDETEKLYDGVDLSELRTSALEIWELLRIGDLQKAREKYNQVINTYNIIVAEEEKKQEFDGTLNGGGDTLGQIDILIFQNEVSVKTIKTADDGKFSARLMPGKYIIKVVVDGYNEYNNEVEIPSDKSLTLEITLSKKVIAKVTPKTTSNTTSPNTSDGIYSKIFVSTDRGDFSVHLLTVDLSQYEMVVDTAADGDCENNCPVMSLEEYVSRNAGIAGIHGTYFCPTSYPDCAGKTNSFYYKLYNGRISTKINWSNGLGDYLPFLRISGGSASYYDTWAQASGLDMSSGISCRPHLVENGEVVVTADDLDSDKESTYKMSHGFIGIKGQTIFAGVVLSSNMYDSAAVSKALGLENSFNLDGGGTTAIFANGAYKAGPGRAMPNAIIFRKKY